MHTASNSVNSVMSASPRLALFLLALRWFVALAALPSNGLWHFRAQLSGFTEVIDGEFEVGNDHHIEAVTTRGARDLRQQLFGRATGEWSRRPSGVYEATVTTYLYTVATQPSGAQDMLLICVCVDGGLRGCIFSAEGERAQIGTLEATPLPASRHRLARTVRPVVPPVHARLPPLPTSALSRWPGAHPVRLEDFRVGTLDAVYYIPDFVSEAEAAGIDAQLAGSPNDMWRRMAGRRVQECGTQLASGGSGLLIEALPPWMQAVCERLVSAGVFPACMPPNSVALNQYARDEGIAPHADGPIYAPRVAILSLGSDAAIRFFGRCLGSDRWNLMSPNMFQ